MCLILTFPHVCISYSIGDLKEELKQIKVKNSTLDDIKHLLNKISKDEAYEMYKRSELTLEQYKWLKNELEKKEKIEEFKSTRVYVWEPDKQLKKLDENQKAPRRRKTNWQKTTTMEDYFRRAVTLKSCLPENNKIHQTNNPFRQIQDEKDNKFKLKKKEIKQLWDNIDDEDLKSLLMEDYKPKSRRKERKHLKENMIKIDQAQESKTEPAKITKFT